MLGVIFRQRKQSFSHNLFQNQNVTKILCCFLKCLYLMCCFQMLNEFICCCCQYTKNMRKITYLTSSLLLFHMLNEFWPKNTYSFSFICCRYQYTKNYATVDNMLQNLPFAIPFALILVLTRIHTTNC